MHNLEQDLQNSQGIKDLLRKDKVFAQNLYAALCNIQWKHDSDGDDDWWSCTWRYAGGIVAGIRYKNEDYLGFYCSGIMHTEEGEVPEGTVTPEVEERMAALGWQWREWPAEQGS